jgi:hypothetical protein
MILRIFGDAPHTAGTILLQLYGPRIARRRLTIAKEAIHTRGVDSQEASLFKG